MEKWTGGSWADLLPKTIAGIRAPLKAAIYASSIGPTDYSLGYVLGRREDQTKPEFDIALLLPIEGELHELGRLEDQFIRCFEAALSTASWSGMEVLGLYAAWECLLSERHHQQLGPWWIWHVQSEFRMYSRFLSTVTKPCGRLEFGLRSDFRTRPFGIERFHQGVQLSHNITQGVFGGTGNTGLKVALVKRASSEASPLH